MKNEINWKEPTNKNVTKSEEIYFFSISDLFSDNLDK